MTLFSMVVCREPIREMKVKPISSVISHYRLVLNAGSLDYAKVVLAGWDRILFYTVCADPIYKICFSYEQSIDNLPDIW